MLLLDLGMPGWKCRIMTRAPMNMLSSSLEMREIVCDIHDYNLHDIGLKNHHVIDKPHAGSEARSKARKMARFRREAGALPCIIRGHLSHHKRCNGGKPRNGSHLKR